MTNLIMVLLAITINFLVVAYWSKYVEGLGEIEKGLS